MVDIKHAIGDRIRALRKERGLSQEELGFKAEVHHTYVGGVERGERNFSIDSLKKIAGGLGVDIGEILNCLASEEDVGQMRAYITKEIKGCPPGTVKLVFDLLKGIRDTQVPSSLKKRPGRKT